MNKRIRLWLALLGVGGVLAGAIYLCSQYDPPDTEKDLAKARAEVLDHIQSSSGHGDSAPAPAKVLDKSHPVRLAIGTLGLDDQRDRRIGDLLTASLGDAKGLELVERRALDEALREMALSLSSVVRARDAIRLGKLVRADWFLLGSMHTLSGTNEAVVRIVDARSGIVRDVGLFTLGDDIQTAKELAGFVNRCRQLASGGKPHTYLALGSFTDVSVNERFPEFPKQLRAYLTAGFRGADVTLLEREQVEALLQEVRLDLAGLTEEGPESGVPAQFAYWVADGYFQSFETSGQEVELVLRVTRILDNAHITSLRGAPGDAFFEKVKLEIDSTMAADNSVALAPTRRREIREQLGLGKDLLTVAIGPGWGMGDVQPPRQRRRTLEDARQALEAVLLLDSENREAKIYLAKCLGDPTIGRLGEATNLLNEVLGLPTKDRLTGEAQEALRWLYYQEDKSKGVRPRIWGERETEAIVTQLPTPAQLATAEQEMLQRIQQDRTRLLETNRPDRDCDDAFGFAAISKVFGTNYLAEAADAAVRLIPAVTNKFPDMSPYVLAAVVTLQTQTNAPVAREFRQALRGWSDHPESLIDSQTFFKNVAERVFNWFYYRKDYEGAAELIMAKYRAAALNPNLSFSLEDKMRMAFVCMKQNNFEDALHLFEEPGRVPIEMTYAGPWGNTMFVRLFPASFADYCRKQLGLPVEPHPEELILKNPFLSGVNDALLCGDTNSLWVATDSKLLQIDPDLNTMLEEPLEDSPTALFVTAQTVWMGTAGNGILEFDRPTRKFKRISQKDGLLLDSIGSLLQQDRKLWIGYGLEQSAGGLGFLDLNDGRISSFTTPLGFDPAKLMTDPPNSPPKHAIGEIFSIRPDDIIINVDRFGWRVFHPATNTWEALSGPTVLNISAVHGDAQRLVVGGGIPLIDTVVGVPFGVSNSIHDVFVTVSATDVALLIENKVATKGEYGRQFGEGAIAIRSSSGNKWDVMSDKRLLSAPKQVVLDGNNVWVAGTLYIAMFDLSARKLTHICYVCPGEVERIAVAGGCLWAKSEGHLYKLKF